MRLINLDLNIRPEWPARKDFRIGCIGSGFIMRDCHLVAYRDAGFNPVAIASRTYDNAKAVAELRNIKTVHRTWEELVQDEQIEILDIAFPPDRQLEVVRLAVQMKHIKGILCQKPLAMNSKEAKKIVDLCENAGIKIAVNSNMRYDQSMRALKTILDRGYLGQPVLASIDMRAIPHWQDFLHKYEHLEMLNMGIHHIDVFRYLFGDPERVTAVTRSDPRTKFPHIDGISQYTFQYANELMATSLDDVWAWPGEGTEKDIYIKWRVEGLDGMAQGTIGWPVYPERSPSTLAFTTRQAPNQWFRPTWEEVWFPDAFQGTMAQLLRAVETDSEPEIGGRDNLKSMAAVDACYKSIAEGRTVLFSEVTTSFQ
ncbi:Gfo/Idh/MocA family oxidoreductase [Paenibacillus sp. CGMCC 1.16610]|uniref:Gfo/Idh/MocA family oxidoreductase n=1 Tax=Paenibacillus anseongense TaxID=2682845 RepID=A0ABW9U6M9_9BACL|nr:Gfo/Idh/MocA family oxidoreductase [Paenibacillus sp. CGMCC 1.16610]MVQ33985.1 gfo/Idh/MocA family oxidoreductase [Paenibacillus anseongense]